MNEEGLSCQLLARGQQRSLRVLQQDRPTSTSPRTGRAQLRLSMDGQRWHQLTTTRELIFDDRITTPPHRQQTDQRGPPTLAASPYQLLCDPNNKPRQLTNCKPTVNRRSGSTSPCPPQAVLLHDPETLRERRRLMLS